MRTRACQRFPGAFAKRMGLFISTLALSLAGCRGYETAALDSKLCPVGFNDEQHTSIVAAVQAWNDTGVSDLSVVEPGTPHCIPIYAQAGPTSMAASWGDIGHSVSGMTAPDASRIDLLVDSAWTDESQELQSVAMHEICHLLSGPAHIQDQMDLMFTHQNNVTVLSDYDIDRVINR
ncbi:MAG TPA: hypothetical protein VFQ61_09630 [Polyangiaceae bacterium]|nr:hypothetical protein [Polyangiaceae bacterium]